MILALEILLFAIAASVVIIVATLARVAWLARDHSPHRESARETLRIITDGRWPRS
jgi:hypothetical protein